ncbi:hypothetical protein BACCAC_01949 [Bacteroides caccae ATCC 43185]|nr:hypothetical protein BACCAC_01949 [Bacteroides caccae ATCC 43185]
MLGAKLYVFSESTPVFVGVFLKISVFFEKYPYFFVGKVDFFLVFYKI